MPRTAFVSDIHLNPDLFRRENLFLQLLDHFEREQYSSLFLLGDVFDLWVGSSNFFYTQNKKVVDCLTKLVHKGVAVHYFEGNHDFHVSEFWKKRGVKVYTNPESFKINELSFYIEHGDLIDTDDKGYLFLKSFLRNNCVNFFLQKLSGKYLYLLGDFLSRLSSHRRTKKNSSFALQKKRKILYKIREHAQTVASQRDIDVFVSGHLHLLDEFSFEEAGKTIRSFNLGSWLQDDPYFLKAEEQSLELIQVKSILS